MSSHSAKSPQPIVSHLKTSLRGKEGAGKEHSLYAQADNLASALRYQGRYEQVEEMN
jgi:hypothetical protein